MNSALLQQRLQVVLALIGVLLMDSLVLLGIIIIGIHHMEILFTLKVTQQMMLVVAWAVEQLQEEQLQLHGL